MDTFNESVIINQKDILYNKDKFDSGEINLCFIVGHSGGGKSSLARNMSDGKSIEMYELDDVVWNKMKFTMENMKEYGDLIYSFFNGVGKKYWYTEDDVKEGRVKSVGDKYEELLIHDFIKYAIRYAKSHKNKKYVIEGVWIVDFCNPEEFKDYAFYIKGTSLLVSRWRAAKRDSQDAPEGKKGLARAQNFFNPKLFWNNLDFDKDLQKFVQYFSKLSKEDTVTEPCDMEESVSTFLDDTISKAERKSAEKRDYKDMMKLDGVRSSNKIADKVLKTSDKAVDKTMKALDKPAGAVNNATNKAVN